MDLHACSLSSLFSKVFLGRRSPGWSWEVLWAHHRRRSLCVLALRSGATPKRENSFSLLRPIWLRASMLCELLFLHPMLLLINHMTWMLTFKYCWQACFWSRTFCVCQLHLQPLLWLQRPGLLPVRRQNQRHSLFTCGNSGSYDAYSCLSGQSASRITGSNNIACLQSSCSLADVETLIRAFVTV